MISRQRNFTGIKGINGIKPKAFKADADERRFTLIKHKAFGFNSGFEVLLDQRES
jgi:hypothetical protein